MSQAGKEEGDMVTVVKAAGRTLTGDLPIRRLQGNHSAAATKVMLKNWV